MTSTKNVQSPLQTLHTGNYRHLCPITNSISTLLHLTPFPLQPTFPTPPSNTPLEDPLHWGGGGWSPPSKASPSNPRNPTCEDPTSGSIASACVKKSCLPFCQSYQLDSLAQSPLVMALALLGSCSKTCLDNRTTVT